MLSESSPHPQSSESQRVVQMLEWLERGQLDDIPCPRCCQSSVHVWFTHPEPGEYRTWFLCSACGMEHRAHNAERPSQYSAERIDSALEARDRAVHLSRKFPKPSP